MNIKKRCNSPRDGNEDNTVHEDNTIHEDNTVHEAARGTSNAAKNKGKRREDLGTCKEKVERQKALDKCHIKDYYLNVKPWRQGWHNRLVRING